MMYYFVLRGKQYIGCVDIIHCLSLTTFLGSYLYIYMSLHNIFLRSALSIWYTPKCEIEGASRKPHAFLTIKNISLPYSSIPIVDASFSYVCMCIQRNKVWCILPLSICVECICDRLTKCDAFLPLHIFICVISHMTPVGSSRAV